MAKFYQRYLPPPTQTLVQYGYAGQNYVVNGQFYNGSNNLEMINNYQGSPACTDAGLQISPIVAACTFEPGYIANSFDLTGSRFSGEYAAGCFQSYGTALDSNYNTSFKNLGNTPAVCFNINTSSNTACLQGCVLPGSTCAAFTATAQICYVPQAGTNYTVVNSAITNYLVVESPAGSFTCFAPYSSLTQAQCTAWCCLACYCYSGPVNESTFGDTCTTYQGAPGGSNGVTGSCNVNCNCYMCINCTWVHSGCCVYGRYSTIQVPDNLFFGGTCSSNIIAWNPSGMVINTATTQLNNGAYLQYNAPFGSVDYGVRTFLVNRNQYRYYFLHNSQVGGIQGADTTSTALSARLSLRLFNAANSTTTVVQTFKKGLSGVLIPSNPDLDSSTGYRFYMMSFNGSDIFTNSTLSQTISIFRMELNLLSGSTTALIKYDLSSMSTSSQRQIYVNAGHDNTGNSVYTDSNFRRQTVNRVWYSVDANGVKRLHLGVYNTNGTGLVSIANTFNLPGGRGSMFQIYSWSLNDSTFAAAYLGSLSTAAYGPRYFCPLNSNWTIIYSGSTFSNDVIYVLNAGTGLYQYQSTQQYNASRLFQDYSGRWAVQVFDNTIVANSVTSNYIDILSTNVGSTLLISASTTTFVYTGTTINGNILVNVFDYLGNRLAQSVTLNVIGATATPGIAFAGGTYSTVITSSTSTDTSVAIQLISSAQAKIIGTVNQT